MGNVDRSHFVSLHMEPNAPIPPYPSYDFAEEALTECGRERLTLYKKRITVYEAISKLGKASSEDESVGTINLDD